LALAQSASAARFALTALRLSPSTLAMASLTSGKTWKAFFGSPPSFSIVLS
jgi:hypothetical protein